MTNCTISGNSAGIWNGGAGIYLYWDGSSTVNLINSIVWDNNVGQTPNEIAIAVISNVDEVVNTSYSLVRGGVNASYPGGRTNSIDADPKFLSTSEGAENYNIQSDSPCIDAGDPLGAPPTFPEEDIDGISRVGASDIGAYEYCSVRSTYYRDADGDGYGDEDEPKTVCSTEPPDGYVVDSSDCNDKTSFVYPNAEEICNFLDDNCDGVINEGLGSVIYYRDADGDSYGNSREPMAVCSGDTVPAGYVFNDSDCDDDDVAVHPGAVEACNRVDDNCSGSVDEGFSTTTYYQDADNDGFGNQDVSRTLCEEEVVPTGYIINGGDCNDTNAAINPDTRWYFDRDGDGFGSPDLSSSIQQCDRPVVLHLSYVMNDRDCNDRNPNVSTGSLWHKDEDDDGYSDGVTMEACTKPLNYKAEAELDGTTFDCDDTDPLVNPLTTDVLTWYKDVDDDGYSDGVSMDVCTKPPDYELERNLIGIFGDCDDTDPLINPVTSPVLTWYLDEDDDGYSTGDTIEACVRQDGYIAEAELSSTTDFDCDDQNPVLHPATIWYRDADGDLFSDGGTLIACVRPVGYALPSELLGLDGDVDDGDGEVTPTDIPWYRDEDEDKYSTGLSSDIITQENRPTEGVRYANRIELDGVDGDCDDTNHNLNPNTLWYKDSDDDGYPSGETLKQCDKPVGYKLEFELMFNGTKIDTDDDNASVNPGISTGNVPGNPDEVRWYKDADNDGYSNGDYVSGDSPTDDSYKHFAGLKQVYGDCDDSDYSVYPGAYEVCEDVVDKNCDTEITVCVTTITVYEIPDAHDRTLPLIIRVSVTKTSNDRVELYYSPENSNSFRTIVMVNTGGEAWKAVIAPEELPAGDNLRYIVSVVDSSGAWVGDPVRGKVHIQGELPLGSSPNNSDEVVPTVNEWGLMFLALLFLSCFYLREALPAWQK